MFYENCSTRARLQTNKLRARPYTKLGHTLEAEVTILGLQHSKGLVLEFWAETPKGAFDELARIHIKQLSPGEQVRYIAEFITKEIGSYTIHAYLYEYLRRIGYKTATIYAQNE